MNPDKRVLAAFDRQRELSRLNEEQSTEEYQAWYQERELLLEDLKRRGENIHRAMNPGLRNSYARTEWLNMGPMEGREDIEMFIQAHANLDGSLDIELQISGKPDSDVRMHRHYFMQFYPAIIEDYDRNGITPDSKLLDDATEIVEKIEQSLGLSYEAKETPFGMA
jgi:hypothetical protein